MAGSGSQTDPYQGTTIRRRINETNIKDAFARLYDKRRVTRYEVRVIELQSSGAIELYEGVGEY